MKACCTQGCEKPVWSKGLCNTHSRQKWREENRARDKAINKDWHANNWERHLERKRRSNKSNREVINARQRAWNKNNTSKKLAQNAKRRADQINATPKWADLKKIKDIYANRPKGFHVDHIIPLRGKNVCGLHVEYNLQYLTAEENIKKRNNAA